MGQPLHERRVPRADVHTGWAHSWRVSPFCPGQTCAGGEPILAPGGGEPLSFFRFVPRAATGGACRRALEVGSGAAHLVVPASTPRGPRPVRRE